MYKTPDTAYTPHTNKDVEDMLKTLGLKSVDALFDYIPKDLRTKSFNLPKGKSEFEVISILKRLAAKNQTDKALFIGGGFYDHLIPAVVDSIVSRGEFLTPYTPYQPEASQGTLQAMFEYQTAICSLTGMDVANASLYDGGTAIIEAIFMSLRITRRNKIILDAGINPLYRGMIKTYLANLNVSIVTIDAKDYGFDKKAFEKVIDDKTAAIVFQNPNFFGTIEDYSDIIESAHNAKALAISSVYPVSLGLIKTPGEMGVDIVVGEGQSLGIPLSFGGPYLGIIATRKRFMRNLPGRIVGETIDKEDRRGYVLTLSTREQHIRRHKATSNICSNQSLMALRAIVFLSTVGNDGFKKLALTNYHKAGFMKNLLNEVSGIKIKNKLPTFNEFVIELPDDPKKVFEKMLIEGFVMGIPLATYYPELKNDMLITVTEKRTKEEMLGLSEKLKAIFHN